MKIEVTYVVCPMGCIMVIDKIDNVYKVSGNICKKGEKYGIKEITNPKRVIISTVKLEGSYLNLLLIKTNSSTPKGMIFDAMKVLDSVTVISPVNVGDIIIKDVLGTGVDIMSSKTMA